MQVLQGSKSSILQRVRPGVPGPLLASNFDSEVANWVNLGKLLKLSALVSHSVKGVGNYDIHLSNC